MSRDVIREIDLRITISLGRDEPAANLAQLIEIGRAVVDRMVDPLDWIHAHTTRLTDRLAYRQFETCG
jgi:hypothetical protein